MRKYLSLIILSLPVFVTAQWTQQTSGTTDDLHSVWPISANVVIACGNNGTILKTTDGGSNWGAVTSNTTQRLRKVYFADANTGYACGNGGAIVKTSDGGDSWTAQISGTTANLFSIYFVNPDTGYACGANGTVRRTLNGGANWTDFNPGGSNLITDLRFWGNGSVTGVGFITGSDGLLQRRNLNVWLSPGNIGGAQFHWAMSLTEAGQQTLVGQSGSIYRGNNLKVSNTTEDLRAVHFLNPIYGHVAGHNGTILRTIDAAENWLVQTSGTTENLFGIRMADPDTGYAVGANGTILKTTVSGGAACPTATFTGSSNSTNEFGYISFTNTTIGSNTYEWLVDNVPVDTGYTASIAFPTPGTYEVCLVVDNGECKDTSATCETITVNATGVVERTNSISLAVFPNIVNDLINISIESNTSGQGNLNLYNIAGKTIFQQNLNYTAGENKFTITNGISNLPTGVYFLNLQLTDKGISKSVKLIKL